MILALKHDSETLIEEFESHYPSITWFLKNNKQAIIGINDSIPTLGKD